MDTKLKNIKYSLFTKFLCWLLSLILFVFSFSVVCKIVADTCVFGVTAFADEKSVDFYSTEAFKTRLKNDFYGLSEIASVSKADFYKNVNKYKSQTVDEVYEEFLEAKAEIIGEELYYAVNNWDAEYYQYEDSVNDIEMQEEVTSVDVTLMDESNLNDSSKSFELPKDAGKHISVPHYAPENIKVASYALNTANGRDFLKYEPLVRKSAFEREFVVNKVVAGYAYSFGIYFNLSEADAKAEISRAFDYNSDETFDEYYGFYSLKESISSFVNLKYYSVDFDGEVTANITEIPSNLSNRSHYILANGENVKIVGFEDAFFSEYLKNKKVKTLCVFFDENFSGDDVYGKLFELYGVTKEQNMIMLCVELLAALILSLVLLVFWLRLVGKHSATENIRISFIDKIPNDIHLLLSFGLIAGLTTGIVTLWLNEMTDDILYSILLNDWVAILPIAYLLLVFCVFSEWISSVVRTKRAGEKYFKNTLIYNVFRLLKKLVLKLIKCLSYKPKAVKFRFAILFLLYLSLNLALVFFGVAFAFDFPAVSPVFAFFVIVFNAVVGYFVIEYVNTLDKIIIASSEHENIDLNVFNLPRSLKILTDNLSDKNKSIDRAVAEAVKNEQMKTQLITNVSHDLKTPLTSLINYSDLLSKCELNNEEAVKYVEVINQKSDKLKHLIEDLIEVSKASTGNVVLNKTKLNLCELAVQAIVEYTPDIEKNFNTIRFNEPAEAPVIYADGTKTYRIISNLLSNVKKYSAPDTRVYAGVYEDGAFGCFEIKNISKEPLDIKPEQLTERFVRGDESRSNEGNGLGLAIAKDLCALQGGILELKIDGDLFKATVKLPLSE